ncbi:MAG: hypothetical protein ACYSU0_19650 [Planctomycetota bacterium]|jgi:hypothetical protein
MKSARVAVNVVLALAASGAAIISVLLSIRLGRNTVPGMPEILRFEVYLGCVEVLLLGVCIVGILLCFSSPYWSVVSRKARLLLAFLLLPAIPFFVVHCVHWSRVWGPMPQLSTFAPIRYGMDLPGLWLVHLLIVVPVAASGRGYPRMAQRMWMKLKGRDYEAQRTHAADAGSRTEGGDDG